MKIDSWTNSIWQTVQLKVYSGNKTCYRKYTFSCKVGQLTKNSNSTPKSWFDELNLISTWLVLYLPKRSFLTKNVYNDEMIRGLAFIFVVSKIGFLHRFLFINLLWRLFSFLHNGGNGLCSANFKIGSKFSKAIYYNSIK